MSRCRSPKQLQAGLHPRTVARHEGKADTSEPQQHSGLRCCKHSHTVSSCWQRGTSEHSAASRGRTDLGLELGSPLWVLLLQPVQLCALLVVLQRGMLVCRCVKQKSRAAGPGARMAAQPPTLVHLQSCFPSHCWPRHGPTQRSSSPLSPYLEPPRKLLIDPQDRLGRRLVVPKQALPLAHACRSQIKGP